MAGGSGFGYYGDSDNIRIKDVTCGSLMTFVPLTTSGKLTVSGGITAKQPMKVAGALSAGIIKVSDTEVSAASITSPQL